MDTVLCLGTKQGEGVEGSIPLDSESSPSSEIQDEASEVKPFSPENPAQTTPQIVLRALPRCTTKRRAFSSTPHDRTTPGLYEPSPGPVGGGNLPPNLEKPMGEKKDGGCFSGNTETPGSGVGKGSAARPPAAAKSPGPHPVTSRPPIPLRRREAGRRGAR